MNQVLTREEFDICLDTYLKSLNSVFNIIPISAYSPEYSLDDYKKVIKKIVKDSYNTDFVPVKIN